MGRPKIISAFLLSFLAMSTQALPQSQDSIARKFKTYHEKIIQEKIFVHLDKANYLTGETLWIKAYCVEAGSHVPLDLSKVAYVEITDRTGKSVLQVKIALERGKGTGSLFIPATLDSDNYTLTAYTAWMKNFSKELFFNQSISIVNPFRKLDAAQKNETKPTLDIQFFPEGGRLLAGVTSKVAFRVVNSSGNGISFKGEIQDENGNSIIAFAASRFGLGTFSFIPASNKKYKAIVTDEQGNKHEAAFPEIADFGYGLSVSDNVEKFQVSVAARGFTDPVVYLFVHAKNRTILSESAYIKNEGAAFSIDKEKLPAGISYVTIFDSKLNPVAERLLFKKYSTTSSLSISTDSDVYSDRRKVKLNLKLESNLNEKTDVSISVFKKDSLSIFNQQDIQTYLHLTSALGQVESPEYYLTKATDAELDNLMLTHGWRMFSWDKILKSDYTFRWVPEVEGPVLEGIVHDETGKPAPYITTYLSSPSRKVQLYTATSSEDGRISYSLKDIFGPTKIYLQTKFSKDSLYDFKLESPFLKNSSSVLPPPLSLQKNIQRTILERSVSMQVQDVFDEAQNPPVAVTDTTAFYGRADETYFLDDYTRFPVMEEVMREYVKGVWVRKRQSEFYFRVVDNVNKSVFNENPLILLDGVPVFRVNDIMNVNPLKIKKIDVLTRSFYHGSTSFSGIVSFTTYSSDLGGIKMDRKNLIMDYEGLQQKRVLFTPIYETERQRSNRMPDQRSVLLWMPSVELSNGTIEIPCFTSDVPGNYEVNVQGISNSGATVSAHHTFTVSNFND